jgi:hypothetical protein
MGGVSALATNAESHTKQDDMRNAQFTVIGYSNISNVVRCNERPLVLTSPCCRDFLSVNTVYIFETSVMCDVSIHSRRARLVERV